MKFTRKQTQIIVFELVVIFLGVTALLRNRQAPRPSGVAADQNISTVTISAIYGARKKSYSPALSREEKKQEQAVTITFDPKDSVYDSGAPGKNTGGKKYGKKQFRRKSQVENIDIE